MVIQATNADRQSRVLYNILNTKGTGLAFFSMAMVYLFFKPGNGMSRLIINREEAIQWR
jgi:hypothetical protein